MSDVWGGFTVQGVWCTAGCEIIWGGLGVRGGLLSGGFWGMV